MNESPALQPSRWTAGFNWLVLACLVLPIAIVLPVSLTDKTYLSLPVNGLSLDHYRHLFGSAEWWGSFGQSAAIAGGSTVIAVIAGTLCTVGCWLLSARLAGPVRLLMLLPLVIPSVVYALGIFKFYIGLKLLDTYAGVIIAHAVTGIPYVVITASASLASFDDKLLQAARGLGASLPQALRLVLLPAIMPGVVSGALLSFMHSWDELVIVLFIASRAIFTVPRRIWDGINDQLDPTIAAVAVVLVLISIALMVLNQRAATRGEAG